MKLSPVFSLIVISFFLITAAYGQDNKPVKDYLNVKESIIFNNTAYNLSWTSHPADNFYKQEYIVKGDNPDKFKTMIMLDVITGDTKMEDVVSKKVLELKKLKESNPVINYQLFEKNEEVMLDFLISANSPDGKTINIVERNVYKYKKVISKSGQKGVILFGVSVRSYGNDVSNFLTALNTNKSDLLNQVGKYHIPEITLPGK
jgi:hypothetical protein